MHVVSEAQNQLIQFRESNFSQQTISQYVSSNLMPLSSLRFNLDQYVTYSRLAHQDILDSYLQSMDQAMNQYSVVATCFMFFWLVVILMISSIALFKYLESLRLEMWKTRSMLNMIPNEVINNNKALKDVFLGRRTMRDIA